MIRYSLLLLIPLLFVIRTTAIPVDCTTNPLAEGCTVVPDCTTMPTMPGCTPVPPSAPTTDTTKPVISLEGGDVEMYAGDSYDELGYSASDNVDGDITSSVEVSGLPEGTILSDFTVSYNVKDAANNSADEVTRFVNVIKRTGEISFDTPEEDVVIDSEEYLDIDLSYSEGMDFGYESANPEVCDMAKDEVEIKGVGTCEIAFFGEENDYYYSTEPVTLSFEIIAAKSIEDEAPNGGDMNGDGIKDSSQTNVSSKPSLKSDVFTSLVVDTSTAVVNSFNFSTARVVDTELYYIPFCGDESRCSRAPYTIPSTVTYSGFVGFNISNITPGSTQTISLYVKDYNFEQNTKYNLYKNVSGNTVEVTGVSSQKVNIGGENMIKITWSITDGGMYDEDGVADGTIVDPALVGFVAQAPTTQTGGSIVVPAISYSTGQTANLGNTSTTTVIAPVITETGKVLGASTVLFTRNLGYGSRGDDVKELQRILIEKGYLKLRTGQPTGWFGPLTKVALEKWQKENGIPVTGYFGEASREKISM